MQFLSADPLISPCDSHLVCTVGIYGETLYILTKQDCLSQYARDAKLQLRDSSEVCYLTSPATLRQMSLPLLCLSSLITKTREIMPIISCENYR